MGDVRNTKRIEWLRVMTSLSRTNPDAYQQILAEGVVISSRS
jgi:hypothetical protein